MTNKKIASKIDTQTLIYPVEIDLWHREKILVGLAESENRDYADDEFIKRVFKKYQSN